MILGLISFVKRYSLPILSGVLIGTSYIPFPPWAIFFCFLPLWIFWLREEQSLKVTFISGWITQFVLTLIGFNWVAHTLKEFGMLPWPAALMGLIGFCAIAHLNVPLAGLALRFVEKKLSLTLLGRLILLATFTACFELTFPMIFDWHFGYTWLWMNWPGAQTAEIWGMKGLSTFSIFLNIFLFLAWKNRSHLKTALKPLALALALFAFVNLWGSQLNKKWNSTDSQLNGLIVQANIGNLEKIYQTEGNKFRQTIAQKFFQITQKAISQNSDQTIDFAIWPETAFPVRLNSGRSQFEALGTKLSQFVKKNNISLLAGAYGNHRQSSITTNSLYLFNPQGHVIAPVYSKTVLLVFGEYIPGGEWFPQIYDFLPQVGHFARGSGPTIQKLGNTLLGPQICYEGLFDWFSRESAQMGAEILINVTNDSWYGGWQQPYQHLYMTLSRAIEVRRPLVRSTNTGISTVILADGTILEKSPIHKVWSQVYTIPYQSKPSLTVFTTWGYWIPFIFIFLMGATSLVFCRTRNTRLARNSQQTD